MTSVSGYGLLHARIYKGHARPAAALFPTATYTVSGRRAMSEVVARTENALAVVDRAVRALESGDVSRGCALVGDLKKSGISIIKETEYLLDRVKAVEKHYREREEKKTRKINDLYKSEQETKQEKKKKSAALRSQEAELREAKSDLSSAEEDRRIARRRKEEAENRKAANIAGAIGFGIATVFTFGLAAPAAAAFTVMAIEASADEDKAEKAIDRARDEISQCHTDISRHKTTIRRLDSEIEALSERISKLKLKRDRIHAQRGEVNEGIKYLHDVLIFWKEFSQLTVHGIQRAKVLQKLSVGLESEYTAKLSKQLKSCQSAWGKVGEKLEEGTECSFSIDFTCSFCCIAFHSLPHLSYGRFCCRDCCTIDS